VAAKPYIDQRWSRADYRAWLEHWKPDIVVSNYYPFADWAREDGWDCGGHGFQFAALNASVPNPDWAGIDQRPDVVGAAAARPMTKLLPVKPTTTTPYRSQDAAIQVGWSKMPAG